MSDARFDRVLDRAIERQDSTLCVGLDPRVDRMAPSLQSNERPILDFCRRMVDATAEYACCFKPQIAYFAAEGAEQDLADTVDYIHTRHPDLPVILDAKRGDVGETAKQYARELFERFDADAATISPYLGWDAIDPYLSYADKGIFVLCHTSNPQSGWLQEYPDEAPVFRRVAQAVAERGDPRVMMVVGATFPEQLGVVRGDAEDTVFLVPGVGAQGGEVDAVFLHGANSAGGGLIVNASRSINYASSGEDFESAAANAAQELRDSLRRGRDFALRKN